MRLFHLSILLLAFLLTAAEPGRCLTVTDFTGRTVFVEKPVRRAVCLIESGLSGLYMLGAQSAVAGVSAEIYRPPLFRYYAAMDPRLAEKKLPAPGNWDFVNLETLAGLAPDLVILWAAQSEAARAIRDKGIPVYGVELASFDDIFKEISDFGVLFDRVARANELTAYTRTALAALSARFDSLSPARRPGVYFMWPQSPLDTAGGTSTVNDLIRMAGGRNVCAHIPKEHAVVNLENLVTLSPDVIVMWPGSGRSPDELAVRPVWRYLPAVRTGRLHALPSLFSCDLWTLKCVTAVARMARFCHPGQAGEVSQRDVYTALYGPELGERIPLDP